MKKKVTERSVQDMLTFDQFVEFMDLSEVIIHKCFSNGKAAKVLTFYILDDNSVAATLRKFKLKKKELVQVVGNLLEDIRGVKRPVKEKLASCQRYRRKNRRNSA